MMAQSWRGAPILLLTMILLGGVLSACSGPSAQAASHHHPMASMDGMPVEVKAAPVGVQAAYRYAVANPDSLKNVPCYCGCGKMGHTSNYSCYISGTDASGKLSFDDHALGCSICVDITTDVMRLRDQGKSPTEIRSAIEATYSKYGPSNLQ